MDKIEAARSSQQPNPTTLPDLGIEVTNGPHGEYSYAIRHPSCDPVTPDVYEAVGNEVQAFEIVWK
jgi:hypothetical protein